jgi:acetolactate synthase-1/2/3 large subunit
MNVAQVTAEILKREGVEVLLTYPLNPLTESAAAADIRPIVVRQERIGLHMADAMSRLTSGDKVGVFCCQSGPGIENAFGAVAQCYSERPAGGNPGGLPQRRLRRRAFNARSISSTSPSTPRPSIRRTRRRRCAGPSVNGCPGPVLIEIPATCGTSRCRVS